MHNEFRPRLLLVPLETSEVGIVQLVVSLYQGKEISIGE